MRRISIFLAAMTLVVTVFAGTALALNRVGEGGPDRLVGTAENDTLRGRGDSDRRYGGVGNDLIDARDPGEPEGDVVNCGSGVDRVLADPSTEDIISSNCERVVVR